MTEITRINNNIENMSLEEVVKWSIVNQNETAQVAKENAQRIIKHEEELVSLRDDVRDLKEEQRIEAFEDLIIKKKVNRIVRGKIGDAYRNKSKRAIAYGYAYRAIRGIGYKSQGSTKRRDYKHVLQAIDDGIIDFTMADVNKRYKQILEEKEEMNNAN